MTATFTGRAEATQLVTARPALLSAPPLAALAPLLLGAALCLSLLLFVLQLSRRKKRRARGPLSLVGRVGTVERDLTPEGFVLVGGELWPARLGGGGRVARKGGRVRVVGARGHQLEVEAAAGGDEAAGPVVARDVLSTSSASTEEVKP